MPFQIRSVQNLAGGCVYGVAAYLLRRDNSRLKWAGVALMGITAMQWVEGALWLDGPTPDGFANQLLTVGLIPLAPHSVQVRFRQKRVSPTVDPSHSGGGPVEQRGATTGTEVAFIGQNCLARRANHC